MSDPIAEILAPLLLGANDSIKVLDMDGRGIFRFHDSFMELVDRRVPRRCLLASPAAVPQLPDDNAAPSQVYSDAGWEVRFSPAVPTISCIIIDDSELLLADLTKDIVSEGIPVMRLTSDSKALGGILDHFDFLWENSSHVEVVYEDLLRSSITGQARQIVVASKKFWDSQIKSLATNPERLANVDPRRFEELIAELLIRDGLEVELTPPSRDGGRDILAWAETVAGRHLYLVECKRFDVERPVGVELVRAFYGVIEAEKATAGLFVTTSRFTRGVQAFHDSVRNRLGLADYKDLCAWFKRTIDA